MNEVKWLEQLSQGEDAAFKQLYEQYYHRFCSFAFKYVESDEEAKDLVQDTLYDFWLKRERFSNILSLKSYLYKSIRNRCLDRIKHHEVRNKYLQGLKEETEFFLNQVLEEEVYQQLKNAIARLPKIVGDIYELTLLGYSNQEIALELDITIDAVKSHKKRGKKILQDRLYSIITLILQCRN